MLISFSDVHKSVRWERVLELLEEATDRERFGSTGAGRGERLGL